MSALPNNRPGAEPESAAPLSSSVDSYRDPPPGEAGAADPAREMPPELPLDAYADDGDRFHVKPFNSFATQSAPNPWSIPIDFWREAQVPEMRSEWMPKELADMLCHEAETWGSDQGMWAMFSIGVFAGALPNYITLQVKNEDEKSLKAARLWIAVCAPSGSGKSPALASLSRSLEELQERLMEECAHAIKRYILDMEIYAKRRSEYVTAKAKNDPSAKEPEEPQSPTRNRLIIKNATLEAIHDILKDQGLRGILGLYDELTAFPTGAGQYKPGGNDVEEMLRLRDGGRHTVDRKEKLTRIPENAMSLVGGTQPNTIRKVCKKMDLTSNGFLQRFNFYHAREANRELDRAPHPDLEALPDLIERVWRMQAVAPIRFSPEAQRLRTQFRDWCYDQRQLPWLSDALKSHLSKYGDHFSEFCLTYHAIQSAHERRLEIAPEISLETAQRVHDLMTKCLWPHARAFYMDVIESTDETIKYVRYLAGKILAKGWTTIDLTKIAQGWSKWRTLKPWEKRSILTMFTEGGWLQSYDPRGYVEGMPFKAWVHPELITIFAEYVGYEKARLEEMAERKERMDDE